MTTKTLVIAAKFDILLLGLAGLLIGIHQPSLALLAAVLFNILLSFLLLSELQIDEKLLIFFCNTFFVMLFMYFTLVFPILAPFAWILWVFWWGRG